MSLRSPRTDLHPSSIQRTFVLPGAAPVVLADQLEPNNTVSPAGAPAANINHMPSTIWVVVTTTGTLVWTDLLGNVNTTAALPVGAFELPFTFKAIGDSVGGVTVGTAIGTLTASWHPEA
jgi:hypothetical protein